MRATGRRWSPSQAEDQIAHGRRLGEERVVAGVQFHHIARATCELALAVGGGASVVGADEVGRGQLLPGRGADRRREDRQALPGRLLGGCSLDLRIAVLEEGLGEGLRADGEGADSRWLQRR